MRRCSIALFRDRRGATAVEYGLICALIVVASIAALTAMGGRVIMVWNYIAAQVTSH